MLYADLLITIASLAGLINQAPITATAVPPLIEARGIYWTAYTAGDVARREKLIELIDQTELNAVVIDLKDYSGRIFVDTIIPLAEEIGAEDIRITDIQTLLADLKEKSIYTIARIAVFQDPYLAERKPELALKNHRGELWRDWKGLAWVDPTKTEVWDYTIALARHAVALGFDEVNFDYIRFPTDGPIEQIVYDAPMTLEDKYATMATFYAYLDRALAYYPVRTSADLFGMVLWYDNGLTIGQRLSDAAPYFDYICPMVYPSHYPDTFLGYANPAEHPYEIVYESLQRVRTPMSTARAKIRPWLQDFDIGAVYTGDKIKAQTKATRDAGGYGWLLWNARNQYTQEGLIFDKK